MKRDELELMAPAGSFESLVAAAQGGADSVYFGVEKMNMRARSASRFSLEDLPEIMRLCKKYRLKSYLTLNIVLYDEDLPFVRKTLEKAGETGVSAIIATDMASIGMARDMGLTVHMSTQVNISNLEAVRYYARFADVMVLARELNLDQVSRIFRGIEAENLRGPSGNPVRLEMFIHGALCMAISGKCYLSLHEMDASANRGECLQTCRKRYRVINQETGYELAIENEHILSPQDLCTIHFLNRIVDAGVRIFKIEGRARSAEYVKTVSACYHEALQAYCAGEFNGSRIREWQDRLATVFNRGFWDGYYLGQKLGEWTYQYGSSATKQKQYIGKVTHYYSRLKVAEIHLEAGILEPGDELLFMGPTSGVIEAGVREIHLDQGPVQQAGKGDTCSVTVPDTVRRSDKVYKWVRADRK